LPAKVIVRYTFADQALSILANGRLSFAVDTPGYRARAGIVAESSNGTDAQGQTRRAQKVMAAALLGIANFTLCAMEFEMRGLTIDRTEKEIVIVAKCCRWQAKLLNTAIHCARQFQSRTVRATNFKAAPMRIAEREDRTVTCGLSWLAHFRQANGKCRIAKFFICTPLD
jgi:hypothetical protein